MGDEENLKFLDNIGDADFSLTIDFKAAIRLQNADMDDRKMNNLKFVIDQAYNNVLALKCKYDMSQFSSKEKSIKDGASGETTDKESNMNDSFSASRRSATDKNAESVKNKMSYDIDDEYVDIKIGFNSFSSSA